MSPDPSAANAAPLSPPLPPPLPPGFPAAGDLAAAFPSFPASPAALSLDAELLRLVIEAKALDRDLAAAEAELAAAMRRVIAPPVPRALIFGVADVGAFSRLQCRVGDSLTMLDVNTIRAFRDGLVQLAGETPLPALRGILDRANEIDQAATRYFARAAEARLAAGVTAAENRATDLAERLGLLYRRIAATPARSLLGVLAKLDSVAVPLAASRIAPGDGEMGEPADVAAAAADLAALFQAADAEARSWRT
jgi:hypothetical protein